MRPDSPMWITSNCDADIFRVTAGILLVLLFSAAAVVLMVRQKERNRSSDRY